MYKKRVRLLTFLHACPHPPLSFSLSLSLHNTIFITEGFYFVRNTQITKYFFNLLVRRIDMIYVSKSHQAVVNDLLIEFSSWKGLKIKTFHNGYNNLFMGGSEYHNNIGLMKDIYITGKESKPYIHHMR